MDLNFSSPHSSKLVFFEQIGSTNQYLLEKAVSDFDSWPDGSVVCAAEQTAGRGRYERDWKSPAGSSLAFSVLIRNPKGAGHWYPMLLAISLVRSLSSQGVEAGLKWPNDVLVAEKKLSGLLGQSSTDLLVLGMGVNLKPVGIADSVSVSELGLDHSFDLQLAGILREFAGLRELYESGGLAAILGELRRISHTLGRRVRVTTENGALEGVATGIDDQGRLVLDNGRDVISAGDILHLRGVE